MDELTRFAGLRAEAPTPTRARLAAGRQRLLQIADKEGAGRHRAARRRLSALGAVTAVALAAVVSSHVVSDGPSGKAELAAGVDLHAVLDRAAEAAAQQHQPDPKPGQFVYTKTISYFRLTDPGDRPATHEEWVPYTAKGYLHDKQMGDLGPQEKYLFLRSAPRDPKGLLAKARTVYPPRKKGTTPLQQDFLVLTNLVSASPADPRGLATVYRAMAGLDGITAERARDAAGRPAYAIHLDKPRRGSTSDPEVLINADTYAYDGLRMVALVDQSPAPGYSPPPPSRGPDGETVREVPTYQTKGEPVANEAYLVTALVDHDRQRP